MTKTWPMFILLAACAPSQTSQIATTPTTPSSVGKEVTVWSRYRDFGDHGISASGRYFVRDAHGWATSSCALEIRGAQPHCGERTPVSAALWPVLDATTAHDVFCAKTPDVCTRLGVPLEAPKTIVVVWSTYMDFSGHGFTGSGRFFARDRAGWSSTNCSVSHVADPQAGPQPTSETCDPRVPVPEALWSTVETIAPKPGYEESDIVCEHAQDVCKALGVPDLTPVVRRS